jgi:hypothetical protein
MIRTPKITCVVLLALLAASLPLQARQLQLPPPLSFGPGDLLVSLEPGPVVWFNSGGTLQRVLIPTVTGLGEGMAFDAAWNLHVARWCTDPNCSSTGNAVEKYDTLGLSQGAVGSNFNCSPHTIDFDQTGAAYIGQAGCNRTILKFVAGGTAPVAEYTVAQEGGGVFWMDLAPDGCTMFYTSVGPNVKRFDVCTNTQLPDFNAGPLPGAFTHDLRVLPDGGVIVANGNVITRLDASGGVTRTFEVSGESALWAGLDLVGDGTFWVGNYFTSNIYRFNLDTGARLAGFNTGTPANSVVGIRVKR